jgi:hypothetical protein
MRWIRHLCQDNSGATLIFVASVIFALSLFAVIAVDISKLLVARAQLQNSADAGALAGAERFLEDPVPNQTEIEGRARDVARMNVAFTNDNADPEAAVQDVEATAIMDNTSDDYGTVTVTSRSIVSQYFTGVLGMPRQGNVAALAAARAGEVCRQNCLKPWSIPDLWDDQTLITGWPQWRSNNQYDFEDYTDLNGNYLWDPGEPFIDGKSDKMNGTPDGSYSQEIYSPIGTGYTASRNLGDQITLKADGNPNRPEPGQYFPVVLGEFDDPNERGGERYRWNIANCNQNYFGPGDWLWLEPGDKQGPTVQGVRELIDRDPDAYWDDGPCQCIKGSDFPTSPRVVFIPIHDPRIPIISGRNSIQIVKIAAFFIEQVRGKGEVTGRFVRVQAPGQLCAAGEGGGGFVFNLSLIR